MLTATDGDSTGSTEVPPRCTSPTPTASSSSHAPVSLTKKISMAILKPPPTVVHRAQFKSRLSLISLDKGVLEFMPDVFSSPSSVESASVSAKSSLPGPGQSTEKTSLDSKFSNTKSAGASQHSWENKKGHPQHLNEGSPQDGGLTPIAETDSYIIECPSPMPSTYFSLPSPFSV
jgi:protein-serine/threonine kinase